MNALEPHTFASIPEIFPAATQIVVYHEGVPTTYVRGSAGYEALQTALDTMAVGSYEMPAFGVSLDRETRAAREKGWWVELFFDEVKFFNDYPFATLLFEVRASDAGFNLARQMDGQYEGRNLYLSLAGNMQVLADTLVKLANSTRDC